MSDERQAYDGHAPGEHAHEQHDIGTKVHGDKLAHGSAGRTAAAPDGPAAGAAGAPAGRADAAINPDHPDRTSEPGTGGLMPGSYEQAGGEAGHRPGEGGPVVEAVRAPGSRVPDPARDRRHAGGAPRDDEGTR